jgi:hypothetical protein
MLLYIYIYNKQIKKEEMKLRQQFIGVKTRKEAEQEATWAAKIVKVEGGYLAFESIADYKTWKNQK